MPTKNRPTQGQIKPPKNTLKGKWKGRKTTSPEYSDNFLI